MFLCAGGEGGKEGVHTEQGSKRSHSKCARGSVSSQTDRLTCYKSQPQRHRTDLPTVLRKILPKKPTNTDTHTPSEAVCFRLCVGMFLCLSLLSSVNERVCVCIPCFLQVGFHFVCLLNPALWISDVGGTLPLPLIRAHAAASRSLLPALNFR